MEFGRLILRKVIQIVAARCHILRLKMHQIRFRLGLCPRPRWGSLQRSPRPLSWISKEQERGKGMGKRRGEGKEEKRGRKGKEREESGPPRI